MYDYLELLILLKLLGSSGGNSGCLPVIMIVILAIIIVFLFEHIWVVSIGVVIILVVLSVIKFNKQECKTSEQENLIKDLAKIYIEKIPCDNEDIELTSKNYKEFNDIVQIQNGIVVKNDYATEVPYLIRNILYTEFIKKTQELKRNRRGNKK